MELSVYKVIFHTKGMEKSFPDYKELSQAEKNCMQKAFEALDGKNGYAMPAFDGNGYVFGGCKDDNDAKEFLWFMEQDPMFGQYVDDREGFDRDWENGDYSTDGSISILNGYVEIVRELNG